MPRKRTLIPSPLQWTTLAKPVPHPPLPVLAERGGTQLRTPLPVAIIDTREQNPLSGALKGGSSASNAAPCPWETIPSAAWKTPASSNAKISPI